MLSVCAYIFSLPLVLTAISIATLCTLFFSIVPHHIAKARWANMPHATYGFWMHTIFTATNFAFSNAVRYIICVWLQLYCTTITDWVVRCFLIGVSVQRRLESLCLRYLTLVSHTKVTVLSVSYHSPFILRSGFRLHRCHYLHSLSYYLSLLCCLLLISSLLLSPFQNSQLVYLVLC